MKRGQIFYIKSVNTLGPHDDKWGRPGIVVSADCMIEKLDSVLVVPLTTHPLQDLPTHASISSTGTPSVALCERVYWVNKDRLGDICGELTATEEERVSWALMVALGLDLCTDEDEAEDDETIEAVEEAFSVKNLAEGLLNLTKEIEHARGERDAYKAMVEKLLDGGNR